MTALFLRASCGSSYRCVPAEQLLPLPWHRCSEFASALQVEAAWRRRSGLCTSNRQYREAGFGAFSPFATVVYLRICACSIVAGTSCCVCSVASSDIHLAGLPPLISRLSRCTELQPCPVRSPQVIEFPGQRCLNS